MDTSISRVVPLWGATKKKHDEHDYKRKVFEPNQISPLATWKIAKNFMNWKVKGSPHSILNNNIIETSVPKSQECLQEISEKFLIMH